MKNLIIIITLLIVARISFAYDSYKECHDDCVRKYYDEKRNAGMEWVDVDADFIRMAPILNNYCACINWCKSLQLPLE